MFVRTDLPARAHAGAHRHTRPHRHTCVLVHAQTHSYAHTNTHRCRHALPQTNPLFMVSMTPMDQVSTRTREDVQALRARPGGLCCSVHLEPVPGSRRAPLPTGTTLHSHPEDGMLQARVGHPLLAAARLRGPGWAWVGGGPALRLEALLSIQPAPPEC